MKVTTESGAVYEFTKDGTKFRRLRNKLDIDPDAEVERAKLRQDGKWLTLINPVNPKVGYRMQLVTPVLDPPQNEFAEYTYRTTSVVVGVEG